MATVVGTVVARVVPDTTGFSARLSADLRDIPTVKVKIEVDRQSLAEFRAHIANLTRPVTLPVRLDLDGASIADYRARIANLTRARTQTITINVRTDNRTLNNLRNSANNAARALGDPGAGAGGIGLLGAVKGVGIAMGVSLLPAIGAAVPMMLGAATAAGTLKLAFNGVGDALAAQAKGNKEYQKALQKLSPEQRKFTEALVSLKKEFDPIGKTIQKAALPGFTKLVKDAAPVVKILGRSMHNLASDFGDLAEKAGKALKDSGFQKLLDTNLRLGAGFIHGMASSVGGLTRSLLEFGAKSKPSLDAFQNLLGGLLSRGLPDFFKGLEPGISGAAKVINGLAYALNDKLLPGLGNFIGQYAKAFGPFFEQGLKLIGDVGGAALDTLASGLHKASPLLHDLAAGLRGFRDIAADFAPTMKDLGVAILDAFLPATSSGKGPLATLTDSIERNKQAIQEAARVIANVIINMVSAAVAALPPLVHAFRLTAESVLSILGGMVHGAALILGNLPGGVGKAVKQADKAFQGFITGYENKLDGADAAASAFAASTQRKLSAGQLKLNINNWTAQIATAKDQLSKVPPEKRSALKATIADLQAKVAEAKGLLNSLDGKTATTRILTIRETRAVFSTVGRPTSGEGGVSKFASGGHVQMFPDGGYIRGPGSGTSDSILALMGSGAMAHVSNTEYVVRAAAVKKYGVSFLDAVNRGVLNIKSLASGGTTGADVANGLAVGMVGSASRVNAAARTMAAAVEAGVRTELEIRSPSKKMQALAKDIGAGLIKGLTGTRDQIKSVAADLAKDIRDALSGRQEAGLLRLVDQQSKKLLDLAAKRDKLATTIATGEQFAKDQKAAGNSFASITSLPSAGNAFNTAGILAGLKVRLGQLKAFTANINKLAKMGLSKALIGQLIQAGPEYGAAYAAALVQSTPAQIKALNSTESQTSKASSAYGNASADIMYDAGSKAGQGFLAGLKAQQKAIEDQMSALAKAIQAAIKKALKIKSPSRVMAEIGMNVGQGLAAGIDASGAAITSSSLRAAALATKVGAATASYSRAERVRDVHFNATVSDKPTRQMIIDATKDYNALHGAAITY
jgi:hypothetical protein